MWRAVRRVAALAVVDWSVGGVGELNRFGISWGHVTKCRETNERYCVLAESAE